jgi:membrane protein YdbS with pleckstrin-like domain
VVEHSDDHEQELHYALQASHNSMLLLAMTVAFGVLWIAEPDRLPSWVASLWFILVIPLSLYLVFVYRRRYRRLRDG